MCDQWRRDNSCRAKTKNHWQHEQLFNALSYTSNIKELRYKQYVPNFSWQRCCSSYSRSYISARGQMVVMHPDLNLDRSVTRPNKWTQLGKKWSQCPLRSRHWIWLNSSTGSLVFFPDHISNYKKVYTKLKKDGCILQSLKTTFDQNVCKISTFRQRKYICGCANIVISKFDSFLQMLYHS